MEYFDYVSAGVITAMVFWFVYSRSKREEKRLRRDNVIDNLSFKSLKR